MLKNINKNRFWLYTGIEMLGIAAYFIWSNRYFEFPPPAREVLSLLEDPVPLLLIAIMAIFVIAWSLFNWEGYSKQFAVGFSMTVMTIYFLGFLVRDCDLHQVSMATILLGVIVARIIREGVTQ